MKTYNWEGVNPDGYFLDKLEPIPSALPSFQKLFQVSATARSEERFSRNAETELVCRLLLEKKNSRITKMNFGSPQKDLMPGARNDVETCVGVSTGERVGLICERHCRCTADNMYRCVGESDD